MHNQELSQADESRRSAREPVTLAASALALDRSRSVIVSDLSPRGALLDGRELPLEGEDMLMIVGPFDMFAKVIWRTSEKAGVQFDEEIPEENLVRMKQEAEWMTVAGWYR